MKRVFLALVGIAFCVTAVPALAQTSSGSAGPDLAAGAASPAGRPTAESVYNQMVEAWHKAPSIYYESDWRASGPNLSARLSYKIWLKKPNYVRLEAYKEGVVGRRQVLESTCGRYCSHWLS